ncbi:hypothetical protein RCL1_000990 [Eukaryota sp. TZLM3-RCL]
MFSLLPILLRHHALSLKLMLRMRAVSLRFRSLIKTHFYMRSEVDFVEHQIPHQHINMFLDLLGPKCHLIISLTSPHRTHYEHIEQMINSIADTSDVYVSIIDLQPHSNIPRKLKRLVLSRLSSKLINLTAAVNDLSSFHSPFPHVEDLTLALHGLHDIRQLSETLLLFPRVRSLCLSVCCGNQENVSAFLQQLYKYYRLRDLINFTLLPNGCLETYNTVHGLTQILEKTNLYDLTVMLSHSEILDVLYESRNHLGSVHSLKVADLTSQLLEILPHNICQLSGTLSDPKAFFSHISFFKNLQKLEVKMFDLVTNIEVLSALNRLKFLEISVMSSFNNSKVLALLHSLPHSLDVFKYSGELSEDVFRYLPLTLTECVLSNETDRELIFRHDFVEWLWRCLSLKSLELANIHIVLIRSFPLPQFNLALQSLIVKHSIFPTRLLEAILASSKKLKQLHFFSTAVFVSTHTAQVIASKNTIDSLYFDSYQDERNVVSELISSLIKRGYMRQLPLVTMNRRDGGLPVLAV